MAKLQYIIQKRTTNTVNKSYRNNKSHTFSYKPNFYDILQYLHLIQMITSCH